MHDFKLLIVTLDVKYVLQVPTMQVIQETRGKQ